MAHTFNLLLLNVISAELTVFRLELRASSAPVFNWRVLYCSELCTKCVSQPVPVRPFKPYEAKKAKKNFAPFARIFKLAQPPIRGYSSFASYFDRHRSQPCVYIKAKARTSPKLVLNILYLIYQMALR